MKTMIVKNPYLILGITSDIAKTTSADDLDTLVKQHYRVLAKSTHPDRRGEKSTARFRQIQEAYEVLLNQEAREHWLAELKAKKTQAINRARLAELELALQNEEEKSRLLADQLFRFWSLLPSSQTILNQESKRPTVASIFSSQPLSLLIYDFMEEKLLSRRPPVNVTEMSARDKVFQTRLGSVCGYELMVREAGRSLKRQTLVRVYFKYKSEVPRDVEPRWIVGRGAPNRSYYWQPVGDPKTLSNYRLIGSLTNTPVFARRGNRETDLENLIPTLPGPEDFKRARESGFPWAMFRDYAHAISPMIALRDYLVAICLGANDETVFHILGRVNQIHLLES